MSLVFYDISIRPTYMKLKGYQIQCLIKKMIKRALYVFGKLTSVWCQLRES